MGWASASRAWRVRGVELRATGDGLAGLGGLAGFAGLGGFVSRTSSSMYLPPPPGPPGTYFRFLRGGPSPGVAFEFWVPFSTALDWVLGGLPGDDRYLFEVNGAITVVGKQRSASCG